MDKWGLLSFKLPMDINGICHDQELIKLRVDESACSGHRKRFIAGVMPMFMERCSIYPLYAEIFDLHFCLLA